MAAADPVLVYFRVENGALVVYHLEDASAERRPIWSALAAPAAIAAFSSSGRDDRLERAADDPVPVDHEDPRLRQEPPAVRASVAWSWPLASSTGWSAPFAYSSWYGSTLMKVIPGSPLATALIPSSVGPHCWLTQNAGVAKTRTNGSCSASASSTEVV